MKKKTESKFHLWLVNKFCLWLWTKKFFYIYFGFIIMSLTIAFIGVAIDNKIMVIIGSVGDITWLVFTIGIIAYSINEASEAIREEATQKSQLKEELKQYARFSGRTLSLEKRTPLFSKAFTISDDEITPMYYNPERYIYTSATVGGITTGGVDKVGGNYIKRKPVKSGKCELKYFDQTVETIRLSSKLHAEAKKSPIKKYLNDKGEIVVVKYDVPIAALEITERVCGPHSEMAQMLLHNGYPTREKCREIIAWICEEERENAGKSPTSPRT